MEHPLSSEWSRYDLSSNWMKTAATSSADQGVFSNNEQIIVWFGSCLLCFLLYIYPCLTVFHTEELILRVSPDLEEEVKVGRGLQVLVVRDESDRLEVGEDVVVGDQVGGVLLVLQYPPRANVNSVSGALPSVEC